MTEEQNLVLEENENQMAKERAEDKLADAPKALAHDIVSKRKYAQCTSSTRMSMCPEGTLRKVAEPDADAKVFSENLLRLLLVGLDRVLPQERLVLQISRYVSIEDLHELIRCRSQRCTIFCQASTPSPRADVITARSALDLQIIARRCGKSQKSATYSSVVIVDRLPPSRLAACSLKPSSSIMAVCCACAARIRSMNCCACSAFIAMQLLTLNTSKDHPGLSRTHVKVQQSLTASLPC